MEKAAKPLATPNRSWPGHPRTGCSSWSRTPDNTPRPAAGDSPNSTTANPPARRCTTPAFPATRPSRHATLSSPATHLKTELSMTTCIRHETGEHTTAAHGLLVIDPYNDFISEGGKIWDRMQAVAEANGCVPHMLQVLNAARQAKLRVFYALHRRYRPGDYETWHTLRPSRRQPGRVRASNTGRGAARSVREFEPKPGEIVALGALVFQWLCQHGSGSAAQEARHPSADRHWTHRPYLHRSHRPLCRRAWLRGHDGQRRDGGFLG